MRVDAFEFDVPPELVAQHPAEARDQARLMVVARDAQPRHCRVADLAKLVPARALVVINDTRVVPARLVGRKRGTGGRVEILLVRKIGESDVVLPFGERRAAQVWLAIGRANKALKFPVDVEIPWRGCAEPRCGLLVRLLGRADDGLLEVALWTPAGEPIAEALSACGRVPLPPYIKREDGPDDAARYQTVYARHDGAVAAPTAGLHVTGAILDELAARGCEVASVTLHVGLGTFQPVQVEDLDFHPMHPERYVVEPAAVQAVARARSRGAPVVAIGTTTARALESSADPAKPGCVQAGDRETRLLIQPGYEWRVVDALLTNFHVPRSTLVALVCSFAGTERVLDAYRLAVRERYRFFSYGDAMLLWRSR